MGSRTLWDALDDDKKRRLKVAWIVGGLIVSLVLGVGGLVTQDRRSSRYLYEVAVALAATTAFPLLKRSGERSVPQRLGARRVSGEQYPEAFGRAHGVALAAGAEHAPALSVIDHPVINGMIKGSLGAPHFLVTTGFLRLPAEEQRAGFAMLLGRLKSDPMTFVALNEARDIRRPGGAGPAGFSREDQRRWSAEELWTEIAAAADREALMLLRDPEPMVTLLERLAASDTALDTGLFDAISYSFLAYPDPKRLTAPDELPAAAAEAFAEMVRSERAGESDGPAYRMNPEATRSARLQDVSGLVGARAAVDALQIGVEGGLTPVAEVPSPDSPAAAVGLGGRNAPVASSRRISVPCPECGAENVPTNARCISCEAQMRPA